jgi:hypothetical protein
MGKNKKKQKALDPVNEEVDSLIDEIKDAISEVLDEEEITHY